MSTTDFQHNPPDRHHYIPVFYTKRWARSDGKIAVFSRPYRDVVDKWLHPNGTGYQAGLYAMREHAPAEAQRMEEDFFKPIDGSAADALLQMERLGNAVRWTSDWRSGWTRFLLSLLFRCPEDIEFFRAQYYSDWVTSSEHLDRRYLEIRPEGAPATLTDYLRQRPIREVESGLFSAYRVLIDNHNLGSFINDMEWRVIDTSNCRFRLLTSDRPVIVTNGLKRTDGHLALPIGPSKLFVAAYSTTYLRELHRTPIRMIVTQCNHHSVQSACRYVYAGDHSQADFIRSKFGAVPETRMLVSMHKNYGEEAKRRFP